MSSTPGFGAAVVFSALTGLAVVSASLRGKATKWSALEGKAQANDRALVLSKIKAHPDFPQKGVLFQDVFPVMHEAKAVQALIRLLNDQVRTLGKVDVIVGLESRGFLFGPILALLNDAAFVPVRKPGKLPGETISVSYEKEYGKDTFEIQKGSIKSGARVVIFDDLLATGGSLYAATQLVQAAGAKVVECVVIIALKDLQGAKKVPAKVWALYDF